MKYARNYLKIFIPVTLLVISIILILTFSLAVTSIKHTEKVASESYLATLRLVSNLYERRRLSAGPVLEQVRGDSTIQEFLFSISDNKYKTIVNSIELLDALIARNDFIHSIYIYNGKWGYISSLSGYEGTSCFSDPQFEEMVEEGKEESLATTLRKAHFKRDSSSNLQEQDLYTVYVIHHAPSPEKSYAIAVNISETASREIFTKDIGITKSYFYIISNGMQFISHPDSSRYAQVFPKNSVFHRILMLPNSEGFKELKGDDGIKYLICWTDQGTMGWRLFYMIPSAALHNESFRILITILMTAIVVLIGATGATMLLSRNVDKSLSYERRLLQFIRGIGTCPERLCKNIDSYTVALLHITMDNGGKYRESSPEEKNELMKHLISKRHRKDMLGVFLDYEKSMIIWVSPQSPTKVFKEICSLQEILDREKRFRITAVSSNESVPFDEIPSEVQVLIEYHQVQYLVNRFSIDVMYEYDNVPVLFDVHDMENALRKKDPEQFRNSFKKLIQRLKEQPSWFGFTLLRTNLVFFLRLYNRDEIDLYYNGGINTLTSLLMDEDNLQDFSNLCEDIARTLDKYAQEKKQDKANDFVERIDKYIRENISDFNLSATSISDVMGLSINYTRTLYKQMKGISINEAIGQERLEKAKQLLKETDMTINEIRETAGFTNYSYFCTYFKNKYQVSPSYYRVFVKNPNSDGFPKA